MKTAERILLTSLDIFNLRGEANVTSVDIALELEISPGNLYYHFKGKELIIKALFDMYKQRSSQILVSPKTDSEDIKDFFAYLLKMFESAHLFRFLYRNPTDLCQKYPSIKSGFQQFTASKKLAFTALLQHYQQIDILSATSVEIESLAEMINLVFTQSQNYLELSGENIDEGDLHFKVLAWVYHILAPHINLDAAQKSELLDVITEHEI
jgi:AcrR family transcriptional regulator